MQFQVPQFIETEDKVVGPFTLRQFLYIGIGGLLCAMLYFFVQTWLFFLGSVIVMAAAFGIAFIKVNGRPFSKVVTSALGFYWKPQVYVWKPETAAPSSAATSAAPAAAPKGISLEAIAAGIALHKSWENLQSGTPAKKTSDRQFVEKRMNERYQIFERVSGERSAAKRVDYR